MQKRAYIFSILVMAVLRSLAPTMSHASDTTGPAKQAGEDRWIPSFVITSGVTIQEQEGAVASVLFENMTPPPSTLREPVAGNDRAVSPFVGVAIELMTPALPFRSRPRFFVSAEILPTFAADRDLAIEGDPGCLRGPEPNDSCASNEDGTRQRAYGEDAVNGRGSRTSAQIGTWVYGANLGMSFPLRFRKRHLRIKPLVAWIGYEVNASGVVVDAACDPPNRCTDSQPVIGGPTLEGFMRDITLAASESQWFYGVGPGLDVELDTGQFGALGVSLFVGGLAYAILGDRTITFGARESYDDQIGMDETLALFKVEVDPWMFRAHVGIRFQWLGRGSKQ